PLSVVKPLKSFGLDSIQAPIDTVPEAGRAARTHAPRQRHNVVHALDGRRSRTFPRIISSPLGGPNVEPRGRLSRSHRRESRVNTKTLVDLRFPRGHATATGRRPAHNRVAGRSVTARAGSSFDHVAAPAHARREDLGPGGARRGLPR